MGGVGGGKVIGGFVVGIHIPSTLSSFRLYSPPLPLSYILNTPHSHNIFSLVHKVVEWMVLGQSPF